MKKIVSVILLLAVVFSLCACKAEQEGAVSGPVETDPVLSARRDQAESYMRRLCTVLWTPEEDILYTTDNKKEPEAVSEDKQFLLKKGRIYRGMPYSFAGSTDTAFLEYSSQVSDADVHTISDLPWQALTGNSTKSRIGCDGSGALALSWGYIGSDVPMSSSKGMTEKNGFLPVGAYSYNPALTENTDQLCADNGTATMFSAYAQLKKADGLLSVTESGGHSMMVSSVTIYYNQDGSINGDKSYVTALEQTKNYFLAEESYQDPALGQVYVISGVDVQFTFTQLFETGHLPITCEALTKQDGAKAQQIYDDMAVNDLSQFFKGYVLSTVYMDSLIATVTDESGNVMQECTLHIRRSSKLKIEIARFQKENPSTLLGSIDPDALPSGKYCITLTCRLVNGQEEVTRQLNFTK